MSYESSSPAGENATGDERDLDWVMSRFVEEVPDAAHAILVSADGLLMASSSSIPAGPSTPDSAQAVRKFSASVRRWAKSTANCA